MCCTYKEMHLAGSAFARENVFTHTATNTPTLTPQDAHRSVSKKTCSAGNPVKCCADHGTGKDAPRVKIKQGSAFTAALRSAALTTPPDAISPRPSPAPPAAASAQRAQPWKSPFLCNQQSHPVHGAQRGEGRIMTNLEHNSAGPERAEVAAGTALQAAPCHTSGSITSSITSASCPPPSLPLPRHAAAAAPAPHPAPPPSPRPPHSRPRSLFRRGRRRRGDRATPLRLPPPLLTVPRPGEDAERRGTSTAHPYSRRRGGSSTGPAGLLRADAEGGRPPRRLPAAEACAAGPGSAAGPAPPAAAAPRDRPPWQRRGGAAAARGPAGRVWPAGGGGSARGGAPATPPAAPATTGGGGGGCLSGRRARLSPGGAVWDPLGAGPATPAGRSVAEAEGPSPSG